ncbi:C2 domain-containing protein, partial [Pterulicium gracile]
MPAPPADVDGTLAVVVLKARNLSDKRFYKQDVYTIVSLASKSDKTPVDVKGGQNPLWDHELRFLVPKQVSEQNRTLEVACWCKQSREDELIAKGKLDIGETLRTGEFDDWIPLVEPSGQQRGDIYLEMTFFSNATPPPAPPPKENIPKVHGPHYSAQISEDINAKLQRRPTKLLPAERLHRPPAS